MGGVAPTATFFADPAAWRRWLEKNHATATELLVGFFKKGSERPSITWPEAVDGALCFGWIDGVRRRIDDESYSIRFTPRRARSIWSAVNVRRVAALAEAGLMTPAGLGAFEGRSAARTAVYAFEQRNAAVLAPADEKRLRTNLKAWKFFQSRPPWYQRTVTWWIVSAKQETTRQRRLTTLITDSAAGRTVKQLTRIEKGGS